MQPWVKELFLYFDNDSSKSITLDELVKGCSPDIDNNRVIDEKERNIGKRTARMWLTNILSACPSALNDDVISLEELSKNASSRIPDDPTKSPHYDEAGRLLGL